MEHESQQGSLIAEKMNLECSQGHRYFSPEWMEWVGKECLAGAFMAARGAPRPGRCQSPLAPIREAVRVVR